MTRPRVALVTCAVLPEPDPDQDLLLGALASHGLDVRMLAWDAPGSAERVDDELVVLRSCWNYVPHLDAFLTWVRTVAERTTLLNPVSIVEWNVDKHYLAALAGEHGVPTVPTVFVPPPPAPLTGEALGEAAGWRDVVIKPVVSAASFATRRFPGVDDAGARAYLEEHRRVRDMMVQPYIASVEGEGEHAVVFIDGEITHAVRKAPRFAGQDEQVSEGLEVTADQRALATAALAPFRERILYGRVDMVRLADGAWAVAELELIEPSLFLQQSPVATERLARAIATATG